MFARRPLEWAATMFISMPAFKKWTEPSAKRALAWKLYSLYLQELYKQPLSTRLLLDAKKHLALPQTKWGDVLDQLGHEEDNAFGLFQALTNVASHRLSGLSSIALGTAITEHFLVPPGAPSS